MGGPKGILAATNPEEIIKLHPQVIFTTYGGWGDIGQVEEFEKRVGIPVVIIGVGGSYGGTHYCSSFNLTVLSKSLEILGVVLGKEKRALEVIKFIRECVNDLGNRTAGVPESEKPTVYVGGIRFKGAYGILSTYSLYPPFYLVHARNVARKPGYYGHLFISKEALLKWNPSYIFISEGGLRIVMADFKREPSFYESLSAFRNGRVYGVFPFHNYGASPGIILADAYFIGKILYPSRFKDVNPVEKANEIFQFLVG